jgi:hypothetical protein
MRENPWRFGHGLLDAFGVTEPSEEARAAAVRLACVLLLHEASLTRGR